MEIKQFLDSYKYEERILTLLEYQYKELERLAIDSPDVEIVTIDGERHIVPKSFGKKNTSFDKHIIDMVYLSKRIDDQKALCLESMQRVKNLIDKVEDASCREVLTLRHISRMDWKEIAEVMNYSLRHVQTIYKEKAIPEADRIYDNVIV